jgi:hypothetical protein
MSGLREAFDQIAADVPLYGNLDRAIEEAERDRRHRSDTVVGLAAAAAVLAVIAGIVAVSRDADTAPPVSPSPTPVSPSPTPERSQSAQTWVDTVVAAHDGYGWDVPDPLQAARRAWFAAAADHLDPTGEHFDPRDKNSGPYGDLFTWREAGSLYPVSGEMGLSLDRGGLDPFDGCRYLTAGPEPSNGTVSCSADRFAGPGGERARISRYQRLCSSWDPGREGDDARPGPGSTYATCGDFRVAVAVERHDGLIGHVVVNGRGTPDLNPFTRAAMAAAAADPRLSLPETVFSVPSNHAVEAVVMDHFPAYRDDETSSVTDLPGYASVWGKLGRLGLSVRVSLAGETPACGRSWLTECLERRVFGADDPTTVFVGAWDEDDWADCCPRNSRATSRAFVYVGPRHTVFVSESLIVKADEEAVGPALDQRVIDLLLDPRLQ